MSSVIPINKDGSTNYGLMPNNDEAEKGLLGALLVDNRQLHDVVEVLSAEDFFLPVHQRIFSAIRHMVESGQKASPVTLKNLFDSDEDLRKVGGSGYLADLAGNVITLNNALPYAKVIVELARRRTLITITEDGRDAAWSFGLDTSSADVAVDIEERLFSLAETGREGGFMDMSDATDATMQTIEDMQKGIASGFATGIAALDQKTGGFYRKEMTVIGGRPGMGKSAFLCTAGLNMAQTGVATAIFSLEMSATQLVQRMLARLTDIPVWKQRREGQLDRQDWAELTKARGRLARLPLYIDDRAGLSAAQIRSSARRLKRRKGLEMVFIDYLQKLNLGTGNDTRNDKIGEATGMLYNMAKDLDVSLALLSQLNRSLESRDDKRPHMDDLRDSGNIEQDANSIWFLFREEYYLMKSEPKRKDNETDEKYQDRLYNHERRLEASRGRAEILIAKSRMEETGKIDCAFNGPRQVFSDIDGLQGGGNA